jgi:hypothetical protein
VNEYVYPFCLCFLPVAPFVVKQTTLPVSSKLLMSRTTVDSNVFHGSIEFEITRVNCISFHFISFHFVSFQTTKGRQLERNFEELKPASHVSILGTILNIFNVFVAVFFSLLNSLNLGLITSRYLFFVCMIMFICFVYVFYNFSILRDLKKCYS